MGMYKNLMVLLLMIGVVGCKKESKIKGYYAGSYIEGYNYNEFGIHRSLYRINEDTVVKYSIAVAFSEEEMLEDMTIDSVRFVWNGKYYDDIYYESEYRKFSLQLDDSLSVPISSFHLGDKKYRVADDNKIFFEFDTSKIIKDERILENRNGAGLDVLTPVANEYIKNALLENKKEDSLRFHNPIIPQEKLHQSIIDFLEVRFEEGKYGIPVNSSIKTQDLGNGNFFVKFMTQHPNFPNKLIENIYVFDFTLAGYEIFRQN